MRIFRTVTGIEYAQGTIIPWYLGRCYYKPDSDCVILAPVPLNFLIGWGNEAWWFLRRGPAGIRTRLEQARSTGFREGMRAGERTLIRAVENWLETGNTDYLHEVLDKQASGSAAPQESK